MTKRIVLAFLICLLPLTIMGSGAGLFLAEDPVRDCRERLQRLGGACVLFSRVNQGRMPASLSEICFAGYITELKAFTCPGTSTEILLRQEIDAKSDYILSPPASGSGPKPIVQDRAPSNHGGTGINICFSDGSIRWQPAPGRAVTVPAAPAKPEPSPNPSRDMPARPTALAELKVAVGQNIYLGVRLHALTPDEARNGNLAVEAGVVVDEIQSGSFATRWGLVVGDLLSSAGNRELVDAADLSRIIAGSQPGAWLPVSLIRRGISLQITIPVESLPRWLSTPGVSSMDMPGASAAIRSIGFSLGLDSDGNIVQPGNRFAPGSERIACLIDYADLPENSDILVEWRRAESVLARSLGMVEGSGLLVCYLYAMRNVPFEPGPYRVYIIVRGRPEAAASFEVR